MSRYQFRIACLTLATVAIHVSVVQPVVAQTVPVQCRPCPGTTDVVLMIGLPTGNNRAQTMTQLWIQKHSLAAQQRYKGRTGQTVSVITQYPANISEFRRGMQHIADQCQRIVSLGIMSHGNLGYLLIGSDGVGVHNIDDAFGHGLSCAMAPGASVEVAGCNVGRSCRGADFMLAAASRLLPAGGSIIAPEYYVYGNAYLKLAPESLLGDRELQVDSGGSRPRWIRGSVPGPECAANSQISPGNRNSRNTELPAR
jgi:Domain of unknown function (DUF4347)